MVSAQRAAFPWIPLIRAGQSDLMQIFHDGSVGTGSPPLRVPRCGLRIVRELDASPGAGGRRYACPTTALSRRASVKKGRSSGTKSPRSDPESLDRELQRSALHLARAGACRAGRSKDDYGNARLHNTLSKLISTKYPFAAQRGRTPRYELRAPPRCSTEPSDKCL